VLLVFGILDAVRSELAEVYGIEELRSTVLLISVLCCARHYSANACLTPLCSLHGLAVTTVEALGSTKTELHRIQVRSSESWFDRLLHLHTGQSSIEGGSTLANHAAHLVPCTRYHRKAPNGQ